VTAAPRILLDTCALIWLAEGKLSSEAVDMLVHAGLSEGVFVSAVNAWEIGMLAAPRGNRPKLEFHPDPQSWLERILGRPEIRSAPLTPATALAASFLPGDPHGDPADRLLIATAREMDAALMTADPNILAYGRLGHVRTLSC